MKKSSAQNLGAAILFAVGIAVRVLVPGWLYAIPIAIAVYLFMKGTGMTNSKPDA